MLISPSSTGHCPSTATSEELAYEVCRALWHERNRVVLDESHPLARQISLDAALDNIAIQLHDGAARCYRDLNAIP